jgi:hypothetical protein
MMGDHIKSSCYLVRLAGLSFYNRFNSTIILEAIGNISIQTLKGKDAVKCPTKQPRYNLSVTAYSDILRDVLVPLSHD